MARLVMAAWCTGRSGPSDPLAWRPWTFRPTAAIRPQHGQASEGHHLRESPGSGDACSPCPAVPSGRFAR